MKLKLGNSKISITNCLITNIIVPTYLKNHIIIRGHRSTCAAYVLSLTYKCTTHSKFTFRRTNYEFLALILE